MRQIKCSSVILVQLLAFVQALPSSPDAAAAQLPRLAPLVVESAANMSRSRSINNAKTTVAPPIIDKRDDNKNPPYTPVFVEKPAKLLLTSKTMKSVEKKVTPRKPMQVVTVAEKETFRELESTRSKTVSHRAVSNNGGSATGALTVLLVIFVVLMLLCHYRKKLLGLLVEGRISRRVGVGRTGGASTNVRYRRLSSNADADNKDYVS